MEKNEEKLSFRETVAKTCRAWKIYWQLSPQSFLSRLCHSLFQAVSPYVTIWFSAQILNELAGSRNPDRLLRLVLLQLAVTACLALLGGICKRWYSYEQYRLSQLTDRIWMDRMMSLDYADIDRQYVYDLYSQIQQDNYWEGWGLARTLDCFELIAAAIIRILCGIGLSVTLFIYQVPAGKGKLLWLNHPLCTFLILALLLMGAVFSSLCANYSSSFWIKWADDAKLGNRLFGSIWYASLERKRALDFRIYRQQEEICHPCIDENGFIDSKIAAWAKGPMGLWRAVSASVSAVITGAIYFYVCLKAWAGAFGVGSVTQYVGAISNLFLGISDLLKIYGIMRTNASFLHTSFDLLDIPNAMYQGSLTTEKRSDRQYDVEFRDVSFHYPGTETWVLRHVNLKFRVGSRLAIVGMNGSGKTTFIKLLCRLYDPTEGQILLNGIDIRKYRYDDYIHIFSVVFQDFQLFAMPLGENVAGTSDYDKKRVLDCLKKAGFQDRLASMPKGLETCLYKELDQEGVELSGGEGQKVAIARAIYRDSPFIILDEPTAALDPVAEADIYSKFNEIAGDKTTIYISHRLSSCKFCDEIIVFHDGEIIQQGTHEDLVADESGKYYELWNAQAQYYTNGA
jgi:ATP-binding cassette subfamily B protein